MSKRVPIMLRLDDSGPISTMLYEQKSPLDPAQKCVRNIPAAFLERFVEVTREVGMHGKFTLLPNPLGLGRIDEGIPGYPQAELERFLKIVREDIVPNWDITPEILTHWNALDLVSGEFLDVRENVWAASQDVDSLSAYFVHTFEILKNVGVPANGMSNPFGFGKTVEVVYAEALQRSLSEVFGVKQTYFFSGFGIYPHVVLQDQQAGTGVIRILSSVDDVFWDSQHYADPSAAREAIREKVDQQLSEDGRHGKIVELIDAGQPVTMVTHWQALFGNGHGVGLEMLIELAKRVNDHFADRIEWTTPSAIAKRTLAGEFDQQEQA